MKADINTARDILSNLISIPSMSREENQTADYIADILKSENLDVFRKHIYQEVDSRPKRAIRFEKKKATFKYPELHKNHPRLQSESEEESE